MVIDESLEAQRLLALSYQLLAGAGLVILAYLVERLTALSGYATTRAQLAEASADIVRAGRTRTDLEDLLQYSVERMGEQVGATAGALLVLEDGVWRGRAAPLRPRHRRHRALGRRIELTLVDEALEAGRAVVREVSPGQSGLSLLAPYARLERVLARARAGARSATSASSSSTGRTRAASSRTSRSTSSRASAKYVGVAIENVRLMLEAAARRHDLELVRDSSLDFAQSLGHERGPRGDRRRACSTRSAWRPATSTRSTPTPALSSSS